MRHAVVITAAGASLRFNGNSGDSHFKKEFFTLGGHAVLYRALKPFTEVDGLCAVAVTYAEGCERETVEALENLCSECKIPLFTVCGGRTRQISVCNALSELHRHRKELDIEFVSIHDGARPFVSRDLIKRCLEKASDSGACVPSLPVTDTVVFTDGKMITGTADRQSLRSVQTPQVFAFPDIFDAHLKAREAGEENYTDDSQLFMAYGGEVAVTDGDRTNIKITYREDLKGR